MRGKGTVKTGHTNSMQPVGGFKPKFLNIAEALRTPSRINTQSIMCITNYNRCKLTRVEYYMYQSL